MTQNNIVIKRDLYLNQIIDKKENGRVKILTGIIGCGKTFLLNNMYRDYLLAQGVKQEQIVTIALDDPANLEYRNPFRLLKYIKSQTLHQEQQCYVFIDEIQLCDSVSNQYVNNEDKTVTFVEVFLELMKYRNLDIYVTGSFSKLLVSEVPASLSDIGDFIHVSLFTFAEVRDFYDDPNFALQHYLLYGGMPHIYTLSSDDEKQQYLLNLYTKVYSEYIVARNNTLDNVYLYLVKEALSEIAKDVGRLSSITGLTPRFTTPTTMKKILVFLEEAFVFTQVQQYDIIKSKYISSPFKCYLPDVGLCSAGRNFKQGELTPQLENVIYNELIRRGFEVDIGSLINQYTKYGDIGKHQVNFVVNKGTQRFYIQVVEDLDSPKKIAQAITPFKAIQDSLKKIVVVNRPITPKYDEYGIFYIGAAEFLLNEEILSY